MEVKVKRADWVSCKASHRGPYGFVRRVARDGSWADVEWNVSGKSHVKRMKTAALNVEHTITIENGLVEITDYTRKREMEER